MNLNYELISKILQYIFKKRKRLIHSLFKIVNSEKESRLVILDARLQAILNLTALCFKREIKRRETNMIINNMSVFIKIRNYASVLDESDLICTLQPLSLICNRIYLMCCKDPHLFQNNKIKMYNRKNILQKHFKRHHLSIIKIRKSS